MPKDVGKRVMEARDALRMSQEELSRRSGVCRTTISLLECGKLEDMKTTTAIALANALNMSVGFLLCGIC